MIKKNLIKIEKKNKDNNDSFNHKDIIDQEEGQYNSINIINNIHDKHNSNLNEFEEQNEYNNLNDSDNKNKININEEEKDNIIKKEDKIKILKYIHNSYKKNKNLWKEIPQLFEDITEKVGNRKDLEISLLVPSEIEKNIDSTSIVQILLINEENLKAFKAFINYDTINNISKIKKENRDLYYEENINECYNFFLFIEGMRNIPDNISLIKNYEDCEENMNKTNKFYILYEKKKLIKKIKKKIEIEETY